MHERAASIEATSVSGQAMGVDNRTGAEGHRLGRVAAMRSSTTPSTGVEAGVATGGRGAAGVAEVGGRGGRSRWQPGIPAGFLLARRAPRAGFGTGAGGRAADAETLAGEPAASATAARAAHSPGGRGPV